MFGLIILLPFLLIFVVMIVLVLIFSDKSKPKQYGVTSVTRRGETVRSIGEKRIADYFDRKNIRYLYEKEAKAKFLLFFEYKISSPDFYLPDYDVYVEYWGLVDADDGRTRQNYVRNMRRKMAIYYANKIKFISIYPRNLENLDWIFRTKFRKVTGFDFPN
jgi:hypothetical protein